MKQNNSAMEILMVCLDQYCRFMERKNAKKYLAKFMELHGCIFDKKYFCSRFRKLNSYTETDLEFLILLKGNVFQKRTVMVVTCHGIIFHISVSTSCFCFHSYFGRPFGLTFIVHPLVDKPVEFYIFYAFLY